MESFNLPDNSYYAKVLKKYRIERKMSQLELEVKADLPFGTVSRIENGKVNPSKETLLKISYTLKLQAKDFLYLSGFTILFQ